MQVYPSGLKLSILDIIIDTKEWILLYKESILFIVLRYHSGQGISESFPIDIPQKRRFNCLN